MTELELEKMYLDYANNFLTIQAFAIHYGLEMRRAQKIILVGKLIHNNRLRA